MKRDLLIGACGAGVLHASVLVALPAPWSAPALPAPAAPRIQIELAALPGPDASEESAWRPAAEAGAGAAAALAAPAPAAPDAREPAPVARLAAVQVAGAADAGPAPHAPAPARSAASLPAPRPAPLPLPRVATATPGGPDAAPLPLHNPPPEYPPLARRRGWQGEVLLRIHVTSGGAPLAVRVQRSSGHRVLDDAAVAAARSWRFAPALHDGTPAPRWVEIPIRFAIHP